MQGYPPATFEVGGTSTRIGGKMDYFFTGMLGTLYSIVKMSRGQNDTIRWRKHPALNLNVLKKLL